MALRVRYFIRVSKKADLAPIRVRFTNGRAFDVFTTIQEQIKPKFWNNESGAPRRVAEYPEKDRKQLEDRLESIEKHIRAAYDTEQDKAATTITSEWISKVVDSYHNPGQYLQKGTSLFSYIQHFLDNSHNCNESTVIIDKFYNKIVDEANFIEMYSQLCKVISESNNSFIDNLITKCQGCFDESLFDYSTLDYISRIHFVGNCKFIGCYWTGISMTNSFWYKAVTQYINPSIEFVS